MFKFNFFSLNRPVYLLTNNQQSTTRNITVFIWTKWWFYFELFLDFFTSSSSYFRFVNFPFGNKLWLGTELRVESYPVAFHEFPPQFDLSMQKNLATTQILYFSYLESVDDVTLQNLLRWYPAATNQFLVEQTMRSQPDLHQWDTQPSVEQTMRSQPDLHQWDLTFIANWNFLWNVGRLPDNDHLDSDLYEFPVASPYQNNIWFDEIIRFMGDYNPFYTLAFLYIWLMHQSFPFEPFFIFWNEIEKPLDDFWIIFSIRAWTLFFEDWIIEPRLPRKKWISKPHYLEIAVANWKPVEFLPSIRIFRQLLDYQLGRYSCYYLRIFDYQTFMIDKDFVFFWNYFKGIFSKPMVFLNRPEWLGTFGLAWNWLFLGKAFFDLKSQRIESSYDSFSTYLLQFTFYPDLIMWRGKYNIEFDQISRAFNWFFNAGDTLLDNLETLDMRRYHFTENYYGGFDSFVRDYSAFMSTYFAETMSALRLVIMLLLSKDKYDSSESLVYWLNNYNGVFNFLKLKGFKKFLTGSLADLDPVERLEMLHGLQKINWKLVNCERIAGFLFGYNGSNIAINLPMWYYNYQGTQNFYWQFNYPTFEHRWIDLWILDIVWSAGAKYSYAGLLPVFFFELPNFFGLEVLWSYINIKIFNDFGYLLTGLGWSPSQVTTRLPQLNWLRQYSLISVEAIPDSWYTWQVRMLDWEPLDWDFIPSSWTIDKSVDWDNAVNDTIRCEFWLDTGFWSGQAKYVSPHRGHIDFARTMNFNLVPVVTFDPAPLLKYMEKYYPDGIINKANCWLASTINQLISDFGFVPVHLYQLPVFLQELTPETIKNLYAEKKNFLCLQPTSGFIWQKFFYILEKDVDDFWQLLASFNQLPGFTGLMEWLTFFFERVRESFLFHDYYTMWIKVYGIAPTRGSMAVLEQMTVKFQYVPLETFLPFCYYPKEKWFTVTHSQLVHWNVGSDIFPAFVNVSLENLAAFENFLLLWSLFELINEEYRVHCFNEHVLLINKFDFWIIKINSIEYQRFLTYIIKRNLYKDAPAELPSTEA